MTAINSETSLDRTNHDAVQEIAGVKMKTMKILACFFLGVLTTQAQLAVTVTPPKLAGQKAVVQTKAKKQFYQRGSVSACRVFPAG